MNDGGPAFPTPILSDSGAISYVQDGMSLRDYFAAAAIAGIIDYYAKNNGGVGTDHLPRNCPVIAYRLADAMLAERAK